MWLLTRALDNRSEQMLYTLDFRGRKYPSTAYFHEQGSDLARGLLLRADAKPMGREGFDWLLISIASNWAGDAGRPDGYKTDKIPFVDRVGWSLDNEEIFLNYAENPKVNQGWMQADNPWQFLAACNELMKLRVWQIQNDADIRLGLLDEYGYLCHLEAYLDGSNNGSQHLSALTRDDITAPHVNLVPLQFPGDLYKYVADSVWERIEKDARGMAVQEYRLCEDCIAHLDRLKKQIGEAPMKSDIRRSLIDELKKYREVNKPLVRKAATVFWHKIQDAKHKRKVCKRNVMTLPLI